MFNYLLTLINFVPLFAAESNKDGWVDWIWEATKTVGDGAKGAGSFVSKKLKGFFDDVIESIEGLWTSIYNFFSDIWQSVLNFITWVEGFLRDSWEWLKLTWENFKLWWVDLYENFWDVLLDWVWWFIKREFEIGLGYADWLMDHAIEMFGWILDKLPKIELPAGFEQGMAYFIEYGMILDRMLPMKEALFLLQLYITVYIALIVHSYVKSWYRWIGWMNQG